MIVRQWVQIDVTCKLEERERTLKLIQEMGYELQVITYPQDGMVRILAVRQLWNEIFQFKAQQMEKAIAYVPDMEIA